MSGNCRAGILPANLLTTAAKMAALQNDWSFQTHLQVLVR